MARLGIGIKKVDSAQDQDHVGLLYVYNGKLRFCHFAWHLVLQDEAAPADYMYKPCEAFIDDPISTEIIVAQILQVRAHRELLAYSFGYDGQVFGETGAVIGLDLPGSGLTCATFIIAFFASLSIDICDQTTWIARTDDRSWQKRMIRNVAADKERATCKHVWGMRRYLGAIRFRPDEVAVSATGRELPSNFEAARALADELQVLLRANQTA